MDMATAEGGSSKKVATGSRKHGSKWGKGTTAGINQAKNSTERTSKGKVLTRGSSYNDPFAVREHSYKFFEQPAIVADDYMDIFQAEHGRSVKSITPFFIRPITILSADKFSE